jgi:hypothetical protein
LILFKCELRRSTNQVLVNVLLDGFEVKSNHVIQVLQSFRSDRTASVSK